MTIFYGFISCFALFLLYSICLSVNSIAESLEKLMDELEE